jgi:hypothetical protein
LKGKGNCKTAFSTIGFVAATFLHLNIQMWIKSKHMGEKKGVCRILVRKPEGKRPLGRPKSRWENNIKMDLQKVGCGGMDWI